MFIKKLNLLLLLSTLMFSIQNTFSIQALPVKETYEKLSAGKLSAENERFIYQIMDELGIDKSLIQIRKPSDKYRLIAPICEYIFPALIEGGGYLFVNETWLNQLTEPERRFVVGSYVQVIQDSLKKQSTKSTSFINRKTIFNVADAGIMTFFCLKDDWSIGKKIGACFLLLFLSGILEGIFEGVARDNALQYLFLVAKKLECFDGAIIYYRRLIADIEPRSQKDPVYWKMFKEDLHNKLQAFQKAANFSGVELI